MVLNGSAHLIDKKNMYFFLNLRRIYASKKYIQVEKIIHFLKVLRLIYIYRCNQDLSISLSIYL